MDKYFVETVVAQGTLFHPGAGNREVPIQERLLARRNDPPTSKASARQIIRLLSAQRAWAYRLLVEHGPGTAREMADRSYGASDDYYRLARRLPELERDGLARPTGEIRDGARVWEAMEICEEDKSHV